MDKTLEKLRNPRKVHRAGAPIKRIRDGIKQKQIQKRKGEKMRK